MCAPAQQAGRIKIFQTEQGHTGRSSPTAADQCRLRKSYCSDVRGCRVLDSEKNVSMTLRAAGRSVQRFTRVHR